MKILLKSLAVMLIITASSFMVTTFVFASSAKILQPASDITYNETVIVPSIKVGSQGVGGVTFFNGTIINITTDVDTGTEQPVTFGDDIRVDGRVWRGENAGPGLNDDREFIVNDDMQVTGDLTINGLVGTGIINSSNIADGTIVAADLADNSITSANLDNGAIVSEDIANGTIIGSDISSSANLNVNTLITSGNISTSGTVDGVDVSTIPSTYLPLNGGTLTGDVDQSIDADGIIKASLLYNPLADEITRSTGLSVSSTLNNTGDYSFEFSQSVNERFFQVTPSASNNINCTAYIDLGSDISGKTLRVRCFDADAGTDSHAYIMVSIL
ncbi:MAG: hypothetical protein HQ538_06070 [Parcubacteria group bacterium]|nr:hypothetical protein [Parcubacteria group bacterium]